MAHWKCKWCELATKLAGRFMMCRPCWRKLYRNKKR